MSESSVDYDVLIAGGGMVGASMSLACAAAGLRVGMLEATPWDAPDQPSYDDRCIALSEGSRRVLDDLAIWPRLCGQVTPIERIHVSDRGHFGAVRLSAADLDVAALGYVIENRVFGRALYAALADTAVQVHSPGRALSVLQDERNVTIETEMAGAVRRVTASLLIVADGTGSTLREQLGIQVRRREYGQTAIISNVSTVSPRTGEAFERFTDSGPLALLPMGGQRYSLVLCVEDDAVDHWMSLDDATFLNALYERFGRRLGRFTRVGKRLSFPLKLQECVPQRRDRVVLIGNAARTLHPVAGQGFNLALRDIAALAETLGSLTAGLDSTDCNAALQAWESDRRLDQRLTVGWTDGLVRLFSNRFPPLAHARAAGLIVLDLLAPLRRAFAQRTMGLHGRRPLLRRLAVSGQR